jgi:hypothetical protein
MMKMLLSGVVVLLVFCFAISGGHAWGALMFELVGAVWIIYCLNKF